MDQRWLAWLKENIERGCNPEELLGILLKQNFAVGEIRNAMGTKFPAHSSLLKGRIDYSAVAHVGITQSKNPALTRIDTPKLQLYVLENFMSEEECKALIKIINPTLRPSETSYGPADFRTSDTSDLGLMTSNKLVTMLDKRIAITLGIQLPYSEAIQAQKYIVGGQFKPHTDYFQPGEEEYVKYASEMGNRTWTFMVYLNETPKGGGTCFVNIDKTFFPKPGRAVFWNNLYENGQPNPDTLHWGMPVEEGEKIIITKWFREKGTGPMFY